MTVTIASDISGLRTKPTRNSIALPLVSIVVVNYNYGRYLREAVDSVFTQTYPEIECIIVDNKSTDESAVVLTDIEQRYPAVKIVRRTDNGGQSVAMVDGFAETSGAYVVFLDADDFLLESFVQTHIYVHLSLRIPVGFTSADMIQCVESRMVLGSFLPLSDYVRSGRGKIAGLLRPIGDAGGGWPFPYPSSEMESLVHFVEPADIQVWHWAPTSGNCFRRDALQLFLNNPLLSDLRSCTDSYLIRGISALTGSVLIDRPLSVYRIHGLNVFSKHPSLYGLLAFDKGSPDSDQGRKMVSDHLIANAGLFQSKMWSSDQLIHVLDSLDKTAPRFASPIAGCSSYLSGRAVMEIYDLLFPAGSLNRKVPFFKGWVYGVLGRLSRFKLVNRMILSTFLRLKAKALP